MLGTIEGGDGAPDRPAADPPEPIGRTPPTPCGMSISLCTVVKNEAFFLRDCLASATPVVDEVIVVDTGSTDGTVEIARSMGAEVHEHPWPGDLGRAHDLPLEHATGDWILSLDGDEVLDPRGLEEIPRLCRKGTHDGWLLTCRNHVFSPGPGFVPGDPLDPLARGAPGWVPSSAVRLFRNRREFRYRGRVHQRISPAIREAGGTIRRCEAPIHHYGFLRTDRRKSELYLGLAERQAAEADDARSWIELGIVLMRAERGEDAARAFERGRDRGLVGEAAYHLADVALREGRPADAATLLEEALETLDGAEPVPTRADVLEDLAAAREGVGDLDGAEAALREALRERSGGPRALTDLANLLVERGRPDAARSLVEQLVARYPGLPTTWATRGAFAEETGDPGGAARAWSVAVDVYPAHPGFRARHARAVARLDPERETGGPSASGRTRRREPQGATPGPGPRTTIPSTRHPVATPRGAGPDDRRPLVVTVVEHLRNGSGRAALSIVEALAPAYRQLVLVCRPGASRETGLAAEVEALGVEVRPTAWGARLERDLEEVAPSLSILHWWGGPHQALPRRTGDAPRVLVPHASLPLPARGFDAWVVLSGFQGRLQPHLPPERVHRIPNAVDLERFRPGADRGSGPVTVAMVARLEPEKVPRRLLHHLPALPHLGARLLVAGRGPRRWEIEPEIAARGLEGAVRFVGPLSWPAVAPWLGRADVGLHLTETAQETCSIAVLEMLASGLPVVSQPRGSLPEMVAQGENGFLCDTEVDIASALEWLIRSPRLRRWMGERARESAEAFARPVFEERWRRLARSLLSEGRAPTSMVAAEAVAPRTGSARP